MIASFLHARISGAPHVKKSLIGVLLLLAIILYIYKWTMLLQGYFSIGLFDESLRLISGIYASQHLRPYTDYGIVYPPGLLVLSEVFHLTLQNRYPFFLFMHAGLSCLFGYVLYKHQGAARTACIVVLFTLLLNQLAYDPLIEMVWMMLLYATYRFIQVGSTRHRVYWVMVFCVLCMLKWERAIGLTCLISAMALFFHFFQRNESHRLLPVLEYSLFSCTIACTCIIVYLYYHGSALSDAGYFIFVAPLKILPLRSLPWPPLNVHSWIQYFSFDYLLYGSFILLSIVIINSCMYYFRKKDVALLFISLSSVILIPYASAITHPDHAIPLLVTIFFVLWCTPTRTLLRKFAVVISVLYFLMQFVFGAHRHALLPQLPNKTYLVQISDKIAECKKAVSTLQYRSLFVGRTDYSFYYYNHAMLYLINPTVPPATRYISDEPGLQNTCEDGSRIQRDLENAPKPLLAFIDTRSQKRSPNAYMHMKSCKKIEQWLSRRPSRSFGTCTHMGTPFTIQIYD